MSRSDAAADAAYADMEVAEVLRAVVRLLQRFDGEIPVTAWEDRPQAERDAAAARVRAQRENGVTPEQAHEQWMTLRASEGWTWGPVKDADAKTSPWLVPYDQLPYRQRAKDHLYHAIVGIMTGRDYGTGPAPARAGRPEETADAGFGPLPEHCKPSERQTFPGRARGGGGEAARQVPAGLAAAPEQEDDKPARPAIIPSLLADTVRYLVTVKTGETGPSAVQRHVRVGFGRAAILLEQLEELGVVGPAVGGPRRAVLVTEETIAAALERISELETPHA